MTAIPHEAVQALESTMRCPAVLRGDAEYNDARSIRNAIIDMNPGKITRCRGVADVMQATRFAQSEDLPRSVHGAGNTPTHHEP